MKSRILAILTAQYSIYAGQEMEIERDKKEYIMPLIGQSNVGTDFG